MYANVKVDKHFIEPTSKIVKAIKSYGDELGKVTNVRADHTDWHLHYKDNTFNPFIDEFHALYPKHKIHELWGVNYKPGDYAEAHNHHGFDLAFVWFVDTCPRCSPLVFPDNQCQWMPPHHSFKPENGTLLVFGGLDVHYVPPHRCDHERTVLSGNVQLRSLNTTELIPDPWQ
tara:strand:- start:167 stop:685 length:519 start_codon:yes stop_codon:yes gene_type:complete